MLQEFLLAAFFQDRSIRNGEHLRSFDFRRRLQTAKPRSGQGELISRYTYFWKNASRQVMASWNGGLELEVNRNKMIPVSNVEIAIVYLRPIYLISTV